MGAVYSSLIGDPATKILKLPSPSLIMTLHPTSWLALYHFQDGKITLEQRHITAMDQITNKQSETALIFMEPHSPAVDIVVAFDFPEPLSACFLK